jgi:glycosyltransferase involved in cell wall biosynthesis
MISIIIPVYNQADKIGKCLQSIARQSFSDYEIIIVNDGSTDGLNDALKDLVPGLNINGQKIKIIGQANQGANAARNRGEKDAMGDYIIFCDADVIMEPGMLEEMNLALIKNPSASYAYSSHRFGKKLFRLWPFDSEKLKEMPYIHTTSLIKRTDFPGFDPSLKRLQDWDLWLTMLENGHRGIWIDKILFTVQTGGTMSSWLPSFAYKLLPFLPQVKKYNKAVSVIKAKHHL